jgi:ABC-type amino acid transport substrate-binding protein
VAFHTRSYTFTDNDGEAQGLAIDLLRLWSKKTGIPVRFRSAPWENGLQAMREGTADAHASAYRTEDREKYLEYASVVSPSEGRIFFHRSILNVNAPGDLRGFRVGAVRGSYHERYIQEHCPEGLLVPYAEFPEMLAAAQRGEIRVFVEDAGTTLYRLRERGLADEFHSSPALYRNN